MNNPKNQKLDSQSQIHDHALWKEFKDGNHLAFCTLYDNDADILFRYGCSISRDNQMVEDAIQDIFIYLWNNRKITANVDNVKHYLLKVLRHDLLRKIKIETATANALECHKEECIN